MESKFSDKNLAKVKTTSLRGSEATEISYFILKDMNRRAFQHNMVHNILSQYETCHTPNVIIWRNLIIRPNQRITKVKVYDVVSGTTTSRTNLSETQ